MNDIEKVVVFNIFSNIFKCVGLLTCIIVVSIAGVTIALKLCGLEPPTDPNILRNIGGWLVITFSMKLYWYLIDKLP